MIFFAMKDQGVPGCRTRIADTSGDLRENRHLPVVIAANFFASHPGIGKERSVPRSIDQYFRCDVFNRAAVCAYTHSANRAAIQKGSDSLCLDYRDTARGW